MKYENIPWRLGDQVPWRMADLRKHEREIARIFDCEPGPYYVGRPDIAQKVPVCPVCRRPTCFDWRCRHVVFVHCSEQGYEYVDKLFHQYFWKTWLPAQQNELDTDLKEALATTPPDSLPPSYLLEYEVEGLVFEKDAHPFGITCVDLGYADAELLERMDQGYRASESQVAE